MRKLLVVGLVLLALLAVADRVAESFAERAIADAVDAELDQRPEVEIGGLSFLVQALRGRYDDITVSGERASKNGIGVSDFTADLEGVEIPLGDALSGDVQRVPTREIRGSAIVGFADLADVAGNGVTVRAAGAERVRVTGTVNVLGQRIEATAVSEVRLSGRRLQVRAVDVEVAGERPSAEVTRAIGELLDISVELPELPYDLTVRDLSITGKGIRLAASATGVVLTPQGAG